MNDGINLVEVTVLPGGLLDRRNAAAFLGRKPQTLRFWAATGTGPKVRPMNGRAFYQLSDLQAFRDADAPAESVAA